MLNYFFWIGLSLLVYTYLGYPVLLWLINRWIKRNNKITKANIRPELTVLIAAYNEVDWIEAKIANTLALHYPPDLLHILIVTDGSDDGTPELAAQYPVPTGIQMRVVHQAERQGKLAAIERVMPLVQTPILVFTDANTMLNPNALQELVRPYADPQIGAVAGEKRIALQDKEEASSAGEGLYWKYESLLKHLDAQLYSAVGAAGELFSIRTHLYEPIPPDTLIEDFYLTMTVLRKGYRIAYTAAAYAQEQASASVQEELKRKVRIAAGGLQASWRLRDLLNPLRYGVLSWQFFSHKILRWTFAPLALPLCLISNAILALDRHPLYVGLLAAQVLFYGLAGLGWILQHRQLKLKILFVPYYFCMMHYAVFLGLWQLIRGRQTVLWEKVVRKQNH